MITCSTILTPGPANSESWAELACEATHTEAHGILHINHIRDQMCPTELYK